MNIPSSTPSGPIGIVAALHEEISELLTLLSEARRVCIGNRTFWQGELDGRAVVVVLSRIGKVAAATTAAVLVTHFGVRAVVFAGVAGALSPRLRWATWWCRPSCCSTTSMPRRCFRAGRFP